MGSFMVERPRTRRGKAVPRTKVGKAALAMPATAVGHGRGAAANTGDDDLVHKRWFLVRVSEDLEWASKQFLSTTLEDFVAILQQCAPVRQLVKPDEQLVRVKLVARDGARVMEMKHRTLTMGDVLTCMQGSGDLVAVFEKKPPPQATVLSDLTGYPSTTSSASSGVRSGDRSGARSGDDICEICAACASKWPRRRVDFPSRRKRSPSSRPPSSSASTGSTGTS